MSIHPDANNLIWIDLEMTGLDPEHDVIIEIATVVTDARLNILEEGPSLVIHQPNEMLEGMDSWNTKHHGNSGLTDAVKASPLSLEDAEAQTLEFLMRHVPPGKSPMCGNTICQDRRFLYKGMPKLVQYFHYRNLDVTSVKILATHWAPNRISHAKKDTKHRALDDVYDSINELRHYKEHFFITETNNH